MIKPDDRMASIIDAFSLEEWEMLAAADLKSGSKGQPMPKELRGDFESITKSPLAVRWRRIERAAAKQVRQKAKRDAMPSTQLEKAITRARAMRRSGATIKEIAFRTGLYWRTVFEHTKQDKP